MSSISVLLAEDEALIRFVLAEELGELGWTIVEVGTADAGIALIQAGHRFDLLVTDINMPGDNNGLDLARRARAADASIKIVVMSGRPSSDAAVWCDLFLPKPFFNAAEHFTALLSKGQPAQASRS